jgi:hypothetical protein
MNNNNKNTFRKSVVTKPSKSNEKLNQYLRDLRRNKYFRKGLKKLVYDLNDDKSDEENETLMNFICEEHYDFIKFWKNVTKKRKTKFTKQLQKLSNITDLHPDQISTMVFSDLYDNDEFPFDDFEDFCLLDARYENFKKESPYDKLPIDLDSNKLDTLKAYPVSINLHKFTTKRDLLDFINKNWSKIESELQKQAKQSKIRFKERKYDQKLIDFLWQNRGISKKELKLKLDQSFPKNTLVYWEISKILSEEKKRRNRKITDPH